MRKRRTRGHYYSFRDRAIDAAARSANAVWRKGGTRGMVTAQFTLVEANNGR